MANKEKIKTSPFDWEKEVLTRGKFLRLFEDIKDLIHSKTKGVETVIREELKPLKEDVSVLKSDVSTLKSDVSMLKSDVSIIKNNVSFLQCAVTEHSKLIKNLDKKIDDSKNELKDEIRKVAGKLDEHEERITTLENRHCPT